MKPPVSAILVLILFGFSRTYASGGPCLSERDFFRCGLDAKMPALAEASRAMDRGDPEKARRLFAGHVRATVGRYALDANWAQPCPSRDLRLLREEAERTMSGELKACGFSYRYPGGKIDWNLNPTPNGYREFPFQLSRHAFWTRLAEYYVRTKDERAAKTWVEQVTGWIGQMPVPADRADALELKNWRTLDAGLRSVAWCHQLPAFLGSAAVTDEFLVRYFRSVHEHGNWLRERPTKGGNWEVSEMSGLFHIALLYPFFSQATEWRDFALRRLLAGLDGQAHPDGFQIELTTGYHTVVAETYDQLLRLYAAKSEPAPNEFAAKTAALFELYPRLMRPDRRLPDLNDGSIADVRPILKRALRLRPERADWRWIVTDGREGREPDFRSYVFPYAGAVVFRTSWDPDAVWAYMDASPFGFAHQHEDKLNVLLFACGRNMLAEGGNFAYDTSEMRRYVLSTRAHNTVRVNGKDQNRRESFRWKSSDRLVRADVKSRLGPDVDWAESSYEDGYGDEHDDTIHRRRIVLVKRLLDRPPFLMVIDRLSAPDAEVRSYEVMWHLASSEVELGATSFCADFGDCVFLTVHASDKEARFEDRKGLHVPEFQGWVPHGPRESWAVPTPVLKGTFAGARRLVTVLGPVCGGQPRVTQIKALTDCDDSRVAVQWSDGVKVLLDEQGAILLQDGKGKKQQ